MLLVAFYFAVSLMLFAKCERAKSPTLKRQIETNYT